MLARTNPCLRDRPSLRDRVRVFPDRRHAGEVLGLLAEYHGGDAVVPAIPAGGVSVGAELARLACRSTWPS